MTPTRCAGVRVAYPVRIDKTLGLGTTPTLRLQRALGKPGTFATWEKVLVGPLVVVPDPHGTALYLLLCHRERYPGEPPACTRCSTSG